MNHPFRIHLQQQLRDIEANGLTKRERVITSPQGARLQLADGRSVLNLCANNYLGLGNHPAVVAAAHAALTERGFGLASVRFICGTQDQHQYLEERLARFLGTEACILFPSAFDANGGLFEALLGPEDALHSDALNHASIIDGIRLCKAGRHRYAHGDLNQLGEQLAAASKAGARFQWIVTDGVFSMDGDIADLPALRKLADAHGAWLVIDDCHATGVLGAGGRGTPEHHGMHGKVDLITGTLGKALGGASGGFVAGPREAVELLRQRARPYLFSNSVAPPVVAGAIAALDLIESSPELIQRLQDNTRHWRGLLTQAGVPIRPGAHPIVPVMLGDAVRAQRVAARLLELGVYAVGFFYPVVPHGTARIRTQICADHTHADLDQAAAAFVQALADC